MNIIARSAVPAVSENWNVNVWLTPPPEAGTTLSAVTVGGPLPATVHEPRLCQPVLIPVVLTAYIMTSFVPLNADVNAIGRLSVSVPPLAAIVELPRTTAHWLFDSVTAVPIVPIVYWLPESFSRPTTPAARS